MERTGTHSSVSFRRVHEQFAHSPRHRRSFCDELCRLYDVISLAKFVTKRTPVVHDPFAKFCRDQNFEHFKILVPTWHVVTTGLRTIHASLRLVCANFCDRVVNYAQTIREHVGTMREDACQCLTVSAMPRLSRIATDISRTSYVEFTSSSRHVHEQFTNSSGAFHD